MEVNSRLHQTDPGHVSPTPKRWNEMNEKMKLLCQQPFVLVISVCGLKGGGGASETNMLKIVLKQLRL